MDSTPIPRPTGQYAVFGGRTYTVRAYDQWSAELLIEAFETGSFAEVRADPLRAVVPVRELDGLVRVTLIGKFDGAEVWITDLQPTRITFTVANERDPVIARHQFRRLPNGFSEGWVERHDVEIVGERVDDVLHTYTNRRSVNR